MSSVVLLATYRYSININDFYMFFRRTNHKIVAILYHYSCCYLPWWSDNVFLDPSRNYRYDPFEFDDYPFYIWRDRDDLLSLIDRLNFDYLCMGNGNGVEQKWAIEHIGRDRCLFSEYGWLPWHRHFYISRGGCGSDSEISTYTANNLSQIKIRTKEIEVFKKSLKHGRHLDRKNFIYVPLQKDVNDFKFLSSPFKNNEAFLQFIHEVTPPGLKVLVKHHPLYPKRCDIKKFRRFIDISDVNYSKYDIYQKMIGMICINSTSILEAMAFGGRILAYGNDIFSGKDIVHYRLNTPKEVADALAKPVNVEGVYRFVSLLFERQIDRARCLANDYSYLDQHYWNKTL